jgi:hypothetical protein
MPKHSSSILELAARGARHRYDELQAEMVALIRQFPNLRSATRGVVKRGRRAVTAAVNELRPRKRRKMSAAARRKISLAQKRRWAQQKAGARKQ